MSEDTMELVFPEGITLDKPPPGDIVFLQGDTWMMKLTPEGIRFNRDDFPNLTEDDFAERVIELLEGSFCVSLTRKEDA